MKNRFLNVWLFGALIGAEALSFARRQCVAVKKKFPRCPPQASISGSQGVDSEPSTRTPSSLGEQARLFVGMASPFFVEEPDARWMLAGVVGLAVMNTVSL